MHHNVVACRHDGKIGQNERADARVGKARSASHSPTDSPASWSWLPWQSYSGGPELATASIGRPDFLMRGSLRPPLDWTVLHA